MTCQPIKPAVVAADRAPLTIIAAALVTSASLLGMLACPSPAAAGDPSAADPSAADPSPYDPLAVREQPAPAVIDLTVEDDARDREIPIRVYLPGGASNRPAADRERSTTAKPAPVILFSHGLGGSREGCAYLGKHWARRGHVAVFLQHPGSDATLWRDVPRARGRAALEAAANGRNLLLRVRDVPAVLDRLDTWHRSAGHDLAGRLDLTRVGMSGHSFGALTTQWVAGQAIRGGRQPFADQRIRAALIFSPSTPRRGRAEDAFAAVEIPWLLMTGTRDLAAIGGADMAARLGVFPALPAGEKYELVLHEAQHSAFTERPLPSDRGPRNPNHHRAILAVSTAFWDAYLGDSEPARAWLDGPAVRGVLEARDRWQRK